MTEKHPWAEAASGAGMTLVGELLYPRRMRRIPGESLRTTLAAAPADNEMRRGMMSRIGTTTAATLLAFTVAATAARAVGDDAKHQAQEIFSNRCTPCHGAQGKGDGAASASLVPKPRNFSDPAWQKGVTDDHVEKIIKYGGAAVGKSPTMPGNPDLNAKPQVVTELRLIVRGFGK